MKWPTHTEVLSGENFVIPWFLFVARDFISKIIILAKQFKVQGDMYYTLVIWAKTGKTTAVFSVGNLAFLYCLCAVAFLSFTCSRLCILLCGYPSCRCLSVQWNPDILNCQFFEPPNNLNSHFPKSQSRGNFNPDFSKYPIFQSNFVSFGGSKHWDSTVDVICQETTLFFSVFAIYS